MKIVPLAVSYTFQRSINKGLKAVFTMKYLFTKKSSRERINIHQYCISKKKAEFLCLDLLKFDKGNGAAIEEYLPKICITV